MQVARSVPHWSRLGSPLPRTRPGITLKSFEVKSPWDHHCVFLFKHVKTHQVIYSTTHYLDEQEVKKQLTFYGKKTVPAAIRKDVWRPYATVAFPIPDFIQLNGFDPTQSGTWALARNTFYGSFEGIDQMAAEATVFLKTLSLTGREAEKHDRSICRLERQFDDLQERMNEIKSAIAEIDHAMKVQLTMQLDLKLDRLKILKLGDFAFNRLIDLRILRDYAWKAPDEPIAISEERRSGTAEKPRFEPRLAKKRSIRRRELKKDRKERQEWLMDQRGSSVADVATVIEHVNSFVLEQMRSTTLANTNSKLRIRIRTPWRPITKYRLKMTIENNFRWLQRKASRSTPRMFAKLNDLIAKTTDRQELLKYKKERNSIMKAHRILGMLQKQLSVDAPWTIPLETLKPLPPDSGPKVQLTPPWINLIKDITALYGKNLDIKRPIEEDELVERMPVHIFWADLFHRKYTDTWSENVFHHWTGHRTAGDLCRAALPPFSPRESLEMTEEQSSYSDHHLKREIPVVKHESERLLLEEKLKDLDIKEQKASSWMTFLDERLVKLTEEFNLWQVAVREKQIPTKLKELQPSDKMLQAMNILLKNHNFALKFADNDVNRQKMIKHEITLLTKLIEFTNRMMDRFEHHKNFQIYRDSRSLKEFFEILNRSLQEDVAKIKKWKKAADYDRPDFEGDRQEIESSIYELDNEYNEPITRAVYQGNEGIDADIRVIEDEPKKPEEIRDIFGDEWEKKRKSRPSFLMPQVKENSSVWSRWFPKFGSNQTAVM